MGGTATAWSAESASTALADVIPLSESELREVARYAAECAREVLDIFENVEPSDARARIAIEAAEAFAGGARRGKALRDAAWSAMRAANEARTPPARDGARAAMSAASAAYLHPLANRTQVKHILGAAAYAACAAGGDAAAVLERAVTRATPTVVEVLRRYPPAPPGGGRAGELMRELDRRLREGVR